MGASHGGLGPLPPQTRRFVPHPRQPLPFRLLDRGEGGWLMLCSADDGAGVLIALHDPQNRRIDRWVLHGPRDVRRIANFVASESNPTEISTAFSTGSSERTPSRALSPRAIQAGTSNQPSPNSAAMSPAQVEMASRVGIAKAFMPLLHGCKSRPCGGRGRRLHHRYRPLPNTTMVNRSSTAQSNCIGRPP